MARTIKLVCLSLHPEDTFVLDGLVEDAKARGYGKSANRTELVRRAIRAVELDRIYPAKAKTR